MIHFSSKVSSILLKVSTQSAPKRKFFTNRVFHLQRTIFLSFTLWQLTFLLFIKSFSFALSLMARLAKVSVTPAEPLGNWATKFAFEFYIIRSMSIAFFEVYSSDAWTFRTYQFLGFEFFVVLSFLSKIFTVLLSTKVRRLTFKAHIVGINGHSIFLRFLKIGIAWFRKPFIFISILMLQSL
jgi:hypothetical protein